ncbi:MAG: anion permease, partial [Lachnospiraceae bacterium]|nr:anion permease [Lachnospiraceae bacterium]
MTTVANGVSNSGLGEVIANTVLKVLGTNSSPIVIIAVLLLVTAILTQFLSNNATVLIMAPIGIALAEKMGIAPYAFVMATFVCCLSCFCTPMATPALAYVMEAGGYKYKDLLRAGFMLQIVYFVVGLVVIPIFWLK